MVNIDWDNIRNHYYGRRKNRVPEEYYKRKFEDIRAYFKEEPITYDTVGGFFKWLDEVFEAKHGKKMSNSYRNKYLHVLKVCARKTGSNIDEYIGDNESYDRKPTEKLTVDEFKRIIDVDIPYELENKYRNFRDKLIIKVMAITTQRPGNISDIEWPDYINGYMHFRGKNLPKNGRPHKVYIPQHIQAEIDTLRRFRYIFGTNRGPFDMKWLNTMLKKRCVLAEVTKNITGRSLRGTGITQYLKDYDLHKVAKISGHKSMQVLVDHYYDPENREIEEVVDNNAFDPSPLTTDEQRNMCNDLMNRMNKRKGQAMVIERDLDFIITVPKMIPKPLVISSS